MKEEKEEGVQCLKFFKVSAQQRGDNYSTE